MRQYFEEFKPKICSFSYILKDSPVVCQMGFAIYNDNLILHTNTWTQKWNAIQNDQIVALCMGFNNLANYLQLQGTIKKIDINDVRFAELETIYLNEHTDAVNYKQNNEEGIFLITPTKLRYAIVNDHNVTFNDYLFN